MFPILTDPNETALLQLVLGLLIPLLFGHREPS
jgi:hypothetical protein